MNDAGRMRNIAPGVRPRALLVDNVFIQVEVLIRHLEKNGFDVKYVTSPEEARTWLKEHVGDLLLIDFCLLGDKDSLGLELGRDCITLAPEAMRICISRLTALDLPARDMEEALNLQIRDKKLIRVFEGFGEKSDPHATIDLVLALRKRIVSSDTAPILITDEDLTQVKSDLGHKVARHPEDENGIVEPDRQLLQIIRQLSHRPQMPAPSEITLRTVGKGRSRTIVFDMLTRCGGLELPLRSIVKIGFRPLIEQEFERYARFVPLFVHHGSYPLLEAYGSSRELAGIAYGNLGQALEQNLPPTFRDLFWDVSHEKSVQLLETTFQQLVAQTGSDPEEAETLKEAYERRFHFLKNDPELSRRTAKALARFAQCGLQVRDDGAITGDSISLQLEDPRRGRSRDGVAFAAYYQGLVHGDLHAENIVFPTGADGPPFLIDFAHTGPHHIFLDHIVLEISCRVHLGKRLALDAADQHTEGDFLRSVLAIEKAWYQEALGGATRQVMNDEKWDRLFKIVRFIRGHAGVRAGRENHRTYYAGLGLAALSCLGLPETTDAGPLLRSWLAIGSAFAFDLANRYGDECTLFEKSLRKLEPDGTLSLYVGYALPRFRGVLETKLDTYVRALASNRTGLDAQLNTMATRLVELGHALPKTVEILSKIALEVTKDLNRTDLTPKINPIATALLVLHVREEIALPENVRASCDALEQSLQRLFGQ